jgi:S-adenosylmethionine:tRNA ribosyltransferase-isomerase
MMTDVRKISIETYDYPLQEHQIARYPLEQRDQSKLLLQLGKKISEDTFSQLAHYLPSETLLITNETKVIQARLHFKNANGASIEVFCLRAGRKRRRFTDQYFIQITCQMEMLCW